MKKVFIAICGSLFLFAGCKEKGPVIDFSNIIVADTTFTGAVPATTDPHNVLAEEFTGQSCPNCPQAHDLLNGLAAAHPGRFNIIGLYPWGIVQANPPVGAANDFRDKDSTANKFSTAIYQGSPLAGIPCGGIDRTPVSGSMSLYSNAWTDAFNQRLGQVDSLNLAVSSQYSSTDSIATITVTTTYTQLVTSQQNLSVAIVEDSIIDLQDRTTGIDDHYLFTNVFRGMATSLPYGDPIAAKWTAPKGPGTTNVRTYFYKMKTGWKANHCRIIAYVHGSGTDQGRNIFQSAQTPVTH